jgi:phosphatidylglycerol:prolipoprotein diacylglycerol transferase
MFKSPGDIALTIGSIDIYWYGIFMSLSILAGITVIFFTGKKYYKDISFDTICDLSFELILAGIVFARLYYVVMDYKYFLKYPFEIPAVWNGGISIQGAIIGGIIIGYIYVKQYKLSFLRLADLFSFGLVTGQIIGRWGNFFNSEAFGYPTQLPWKLYIPYSSRPLEYKAQEFFHPAFLYESLLNVGVLLILFLLLTKVKNRKDGLIFFSYIILYSVVRIIVETIRIDSVLSFGSIHVAHIASAVFILIGIIGLFYINKQKNDVVS